MPFWCGAWGASGWWWIFPLLCFGVMAVFAFVCMRGFGCLGWRSGHGRDDVAALQRELRDLKDDVRKLRGGT